MCEKVTNWAQATLEGSHAVQRERQFAIYKLILFRQCRILWAVRDLVFNFMPQESQIESMAAGWPAEQLYFMCRVKLDFQVNFIPQSGQEGSPTTIKRKEKEK